MIKLNIQFAAGVSKIELEPVRKVISALEQEKSVKTPDPAVVNVRIVDRSKVQEYNRRFAGKDEPTDVLSFNYGQGHPRAGEELGDIVISYQHVIGQAKQAGTDEPTELALLTLHGILHLLGHDHATKDEQKAVDSLQEKLMAKAGLSARQFEWKS